MREFIKNLGLLSIFAGVIILSIAVFNETQTNTKLGISLILVVAGLLAHILLNKYIE